MALSRPKPMAKNMGLTRGRRRNCGGKINNKSK
jgi:hypothetical protein